MLKQNPKVEEPYAGDPLVRVCEGDRMKVLSLLGAALKTQRHREEKKSGEEFEQKAAKTTKREDRPENVAVFECRGA